MEDSSLECVSSPAGQSSSRSKLDTLSKEDLIKFAKKQMAAMQKIKSKCAGLEKEVEELKHPQSGSDSSVIQELSERMEAVLLEKAESQQSLSLLRREHEELQKQAQETVATLSALQEELDLRNKEYTEMQKHTAELTEDFKAACTEYESKISQAGEELAEAKHQWMAETEKLKDSHQMSLTESQQETENLQREMETLRRPYEDEVRFLEEQLEVNAADFERERERLLLLHDELTEQLALKEGFLQDVQEEEEDASRAAAPPKHSPSAQTSDLPASDDSSDEGGAMEDLQSQNMMLQEELVFLRNVKLELESELKQMREEFTVEKDELEFRINELQMNRDNADTSVERCGVQTLDESHSDDLKETRSSAGREEMQHDGRSALSEDESTAADTFEQTVSPVTDQEDLGDRAERFMKQYRAVKERTAGSLQDLQEKLQSVFQQRDRLFEQIRNAEETSVEEEGLEMSFEDLRNTNEEILVSLQHKETLVLELKEMLKSMASESKLNQRRNLSEDKHMKTLEEDASALQARQQECQDTIRLLQSQITSLSEERDTLRRDVEQLLTHAQAERAVLHQRLEEAGQERAARIHELLRKKDLLKASLEDVLLDTEGLQKDLRDMQAMNVKLRAENHSLLSTR